MEARHAVGGGCATCIVGPLMADVQASDGGEEDLQRERCWEVSFTERRMRCRLKAFRHLVPRLNVQPVRSYNVGETPKIKRIPDQSNHNENIIQLFFCHTLKSPMLQFVNVNGARRPSLSFLNVVEKPSLSCPQCYCASQSFWEQVIKMSCGATVFPFSLLPLLAAGSFHPAAC